MAIDFNVPSQVRPYANLAAFPVTGAVKTIYIDEEFNYMYRWNGTAYIAISVADLVGYVPYTGATGNVDLGTHTIIAQNATISSSGSGNTATITHSGGSGIGLSITKGGSGEALYVNKTSGSGNAVTVVGNIEATNLKRTGGTSSQFLKADGSVDSTTYITGITIGTTAITSGTVGRVLFEGAGNVVQESANLFWDNTNRRLGIGTSTAPSGSLYIDNSGNDVQQHLVLKNSNAGSGAQVHLDLHNNVAGSTYSSGASLFFCSSTTPSPYASALGFWNYQNGPIALATISVERMRVSAGGNVLINTTTDAGFKLDVNGTARVSGNLTVATGFEFVFNNQNVGLYRSANNLRLGGFGGIEFLSSETTIASQTIRMTLKNNGNLLINTTTDVASSKLTIESTTQGFLPPRMTTTQKNSIATPATGLMVYDTTLNLISVYNGTIWISL